MLLYNQVSKPVEWEANGVDYKWAPYGSCEVPDIYVPLLKLEGFPVDSVPIPPKEKAERAAAAMSEDAKEAEIQKLKKQLSDEEARAGESKRAAEAADLRATSAREHAEKAFEKVSALEEEIRTLRSDAAEYEKMIADQSSEIARLEETLQIELAKQTLGKPEPSKESDGKQNKPPKNS